LDSGRGMILPGFFSREERSALVALARDGSVTHRLALRANALVLLDEGVSCEQVAKVLTLGRITWSGEDGSGKTHFRHDGRCAMTESKRENG
jgi:hypothetical protein